MKLKVEIFKAEHSIPAPIVATLKTLHANGHEAYLAGGCVRDALLGRKPKDFDIATSATPEQVEALFEKTISVGRDFGVMVVVVRGEKTSTSIEVATFRNDGAYVDGRRPESVTFSSPEEDASRRDFTINGLFYDMRSGTVVDFVGGYEDLQTRVVRSIGSARARFTEDKLRIIRAIRFASELEFKLDQETLEAIKDMAPQLSAVSAERVTEEINKMLGGSHPGGAFQVLFDLGVSNIIFKNFSAFSPSRFFELLKFSLGLIEKDVLLGWMLVAFYEWRARATLPFVDEAPREALDAFASALHIDAVIDLLSQFRLSRDTLRTIESSLRNWDAFHKLDTSALLILNDSFGLSLFQMAMVVNVAESTLNGQPVNADFDGFMKRYQSLSGSDGRLEACWLSGNDLAAAGIPKGPAYKDILGEAYKLQLDRKVSSRDELLKWLANVRSDTKR